MTVIAAKSTQSFPAALHCLRLGSLRGERFFFFFLISSLCNEKYDPWNQSIISHLTSQTQFHSSALKRTRAMLLHLSP